MYYLNSILMYYLNYKSITQSYLKLNMTLVIAFVCSTSGRAANSSSTKG